MLRMSCRTTLPLTKCLTSPTKRPDRCATSAISPIDALARDVHVHVSLAPNGGQYAGIDQIHAVQDGILHGRFPDRIASLHKNKKQERKNMRQ